MKSFLSPKCPPRPDLLECHTLEWSGKGLKIEWMSFSKSEWHRKEGLGKAVRWYLKCQECRVYDTDLYISVGCFVVLVDTSYKRISDCIFLYILEISYTAFTGSWIWLGKFKSTHGDSTHLLARQHHKLSFWCIFPTFLPWLRIHPHSQWHIVKFQRGWLMLETQRAKFHHLSLH